MWQYYVSKCTFSHYSIKTSSLNCHVLPIPLHVIRGQHCQLTCWTPSTNWRQEAQTGGEEGWERVRVKGVEGEKGVGGGGALPGGGLRLTHEHASWRRPKWSVLSRWRLRSRRGRRSCRRSCRSGIRFLNLSYWSLCDRDLFTPVFGTDHRTWLIVYS